MFSTIFSGLTKLFILILIYTAQHNQMHSKLHVNKLSTYFSSPPTLSFWWVELGPHVRPFFLLPDRSSFLQTALRPQVLLPSVGVTGTQKKSVWNTHLYVFSHKEHSRFFHVFTLTSDCPQAGNDPRTGRRCSVLTPLSLPLVHTRRSLDCNLMFKAFR